MKVHIGKILSQIFQKISLREIKILNYQFDLSNCSIAFFHRIKNKFPITINLFFYCYLIQKFQSNNREQEVLGIIHSISI